MNIMYKQVAKPVLAAKIRDARGFAPFGAAVSASAPMRGAI
jgi:hypothetical protein